MNESQYNLRFETDLNKGITLTQLRMAFLQDDHNAHTFTIKTTVGGESNSLDGTIKGYFIPQTVEDMTIEIGGDYTNDGEAKVTLTQDCYAFAGRFFLIIRQEKNFAKTSIFYAEGYVSKTRTDKVIEPSGVVPSLSALEERINNLTYSDVGAAPAVEDATYAGCYYRMINGVKEWVNPPMELGVEYRTTKRHNGKVVYAAAVNAGILPNKAYKDVALLSSITELVDLRLLAGDTATGKYKSYSSNYVADDVNLQVMFYNQVRIYSVATDSSAMTGVIRIEYCKD